MRLRSLTLAMLALASFPVLDAGWAHDSEARKDSSIQVGVRPFFLIEGMDNSRLKQKLERCENGPFRRSDFVIAHRGAPLQFPEHTKESYEAGARQGAGIVECDVTFTKDGELVCRHAADTAREHRAQSQTRRQTHARAEGRR